MTDVLRFVGETPLAELKKINNTDCRLFAKLEFLNPSGSIKDRMAHEMVLRAEKNGDLKPGMRIIEATSGNTGISFAMIAAARGYRFTAVMPASMTVERKRMITAFGGELILTPAKNDMEGTMRKLEQLQRTVENVWFPQQFENPDNTKAHVKTGNEIVKDIASLGAGKVDAFVAGVGTGGTLMGVAEALRKKNKNAKIIAVEPAESAVMSGGRSGRHEIEGIGEGFVPPLVDFDRIDEIIRIRSKDAVSMTKRIAREEGMLCGISSGANVLAALQVGRRKEFRGKNVVTVLCDRGERYLSMGIFK